MLFRIPRPLPPLWVLWAIVSELVALDAILLGVLIFLGIHWPPSDAARLIAAAICLIAFTITGFATLQFMAAARDHEEG